MKKDATRTLDYDTGGRRKFQWTSAPRGASVGLSSIGETNGVESEMTLAKIERDLKAGKLTANQAAFMRKWLNERN
jgi:hypothetical protein